MTHRIIFLNEIGRIGDMITNKSEAEKKLFWERVKNKIDKWGSTFSGRMLSWHPWDFSKFPSIHLWHIKPNNPMQFKNAHDKFVESAGSYFDGKAIGFSSKPLVFKAFFLRLIMIKGRPAYISDEKLSIYSCL